jgi:hypothetical protein
MGSWNDFQVMNANQTQKPWQKVHRDKIHGVHEKHPNEDGKCQGTDDGVVTRKNILDLLIDEFNDRFQQILNTTGIVRIEIPAYFPRKQHKEKGKYRAYEKGIQEKYGKVDK